MMGYPSIADFKNAIKYNYITDCPVKIEDIEIAEDIFGKDIHALKGKTVRKTPEHTIIDTIEVPKDILKLHNNLTIGIDFMFINGLPFFVTTSWKIKFSTVEYTNKMNKSTIIDCLDAVIKLYAARGFRIKNVLVDEQFDFLKEEWNRK